VRRWWLLPLCLALFGCVRLGFSVDSDGSPDQRVVDAYSSPSDIRPTADVDSTAAVDSAAIDGKNSDSQAMPCANQADGTPCDDNNICTSSSTCQAGVCQGSGGTAPCTVADSKAAYGSVQGGKGWWYGYWHAEVDADGTYHPKVDFQEMVQGSAGEWEPADAEVNPTWCYLAHWWEHPGSQPLKVPVRRWISDVSGPARVLVSFNMADTGGGDGARKTLVVDGVELWSKEVGGKDPTVYTAQVDVELAVGTLVDFLLHPLAHDAQDTCNFEASVVSR
jgi:hypothetical protein